MNSPEPHSIKTLQVLSTRATRIVSTFLQNTLRMPRLHTARFSGIIMEQEHLTPLFQSNSLHTLILSRCSLCNMVGLPPPHIRHLTLQSISVDNWLHMVSLFGHCNANLETLDHVGELGQVPGPTRLPIFPKLRNLKLVTASVLVDHIGRFIPLTPQLEHLEIWGSHPNSGLLALPASLNRLTIGQWMVEHSRFDHHPLLHLSHLRIQYYDHVADSNRRGIIIPIIQHAFPNLTSLEVDIRYCSRSFVLLVARSLPYVTRLQLNIKGTLNTLEYNHDTSQYFTETLEGPLSHLSVDVNVAHHHKSGMELFKKWVIHTVLQPTVGLGGPHLQEVEMVFSRSGTDILDAWWCWKQVKEKWVFKQY